MFQEVKIDLRKNSSVMKTPNSGKLIKILLANKDDLNIASIYNTNIKPDSTNYCCISIVHSNEERTMLRCVMIYPYSKKLTVTGTELHCPTSNKMIYCMA